MDYLNLYIKDEGKNTAISAMSIGIIVDVILS